MEDPRDHGTYFGSGGDVFWPRSPPMKWFPGSFMIAGLAELG
jgi:hypothetical protein